MSELLVFIGTLISVFVGIILFGLLFRKLGWIPK